MVAQRSTIVSGAPLPTANEVAGFGAGFAVDSALAETHAHHFQLGPLCSVTNTGKLMDHHTTALFLPAMTALVRRVLLDHRGRQVSFQGLLHGGLNVLHQSLLILLDRQDVVASAGDNLPSDLLLAT